MSLLDIAKTGLGASRKALEVAGHNISNVNTEGYTRQKIEQQTTPAIKREGIVSGRGVFINGVDRVHDPLLEKRMQGSLSDVSYYEERNQQISKIEDIFNNLGVDGLNNILNGFYNTFRELSNNPANESIRSLVRDRAEFVAEKFRQTRGHLDSFAGEIDQKIKLEISDVNNILENIARYNKEIKEIEVLRGVEPNLRDQRDKSIRELAKFFKIKTYVDGRGHYNVAAENLGSLVVGGVHQKLSAVSRVPKGRGAEAPGEMHIYIGDSGARSVEKKVRGGRIGSLVRARNEDVRDMQHKMDKIAYEFVNTVNAVHRKGYANRKIHTDENGKFNTVDGRGKTTEINFFKTPDKVYNASLNIDVSDEVKNDLSNIVTALSPNSPGDNRIALAISKLQHEKIMEGGTATIEESYLQSVAHVGFEGGRAKIDEEQARGILTQVEVLKERTSGVSIDEETANMVRLQHVYGASAKVMQTAKDLFEELLSIKR